MCCNDVLAYFDICSDTTVHRCTETSKAVMMKVFEYTSRAVIEKYGIVKVIDIQKEIEHRYDYYMSMVFTHSTSIVSEHSRCTSRVCIQRKMHRYS